MTTETKLKFGLMTGSDEKTLIKTMDLVNEAFPEGIINTLEIGIHRGHTSRAIHQFFSERNRINFHVAVDNEHDVQDGSPFEGCRFLIGNSIDVYTDIHDNSQHFAFLDACHSYVYSMADFLVYSDKIRIGGYLAMHDTSPHINPFTDYQGHGSKFEQDMFISCRKAIKKLGLLDNRFEGWQLVFDECDPKALTGGVTVLKRIS